MDLYTLNPSNLFHWIVAFALFEIPMAYTYVKLLDGGESVTDWYSGKNINIWNVMIQDSVYVIVGIIIALRLLDFVNRNYSIRKNAYTFFLTFLGVQLLGDTTFAIIIKSLSKSTISRSKWLTFFDNYINTAGYWALIGDSLYILAWTLSFLFVSYYIKRFDIKIAIICTFLFFVSIYSET